MKKRSMLAFASLAVGVVASLTAPSAHAETGADAREPHKLSNPDLGADIAHAMQQAKHDPGNRDHRTSS